MMNFETERESYFAKTPIDFLIFIVMTVLIYYSDVITLLFTEK